MTLPSSSPLVFWSFLLSGLVSSPKWHHACLHPSRWQTVVSVTRRTSSLHQGKAASKPGAAPVQSLSARDQCSPHYIHGRQQPSSKERLCTFALWKYSVRKGVWVSTSESSQRILTETSGWLLGNEKKKRLLADTVKSKPIARAGVSWQQGASPQHYHSTKGGGWSERPHGMWSFCTWDV